ncbi:unnamed protein product [Nippostrongylus brasiliensis]|uniref:Transposase n=1 Tax=Nippostrongylus brasiliensis TaxID=27835 RepID=A0A0N4XX45_NIPBR|nr:unnamed protein product [Nippostrongylus brasiliensis]
MPSAGDHSDVRRTLDKWPSTDGCLLTRKLVVLRAAKYGRMVEQPVQWAPTTGCGRSVATRWVATSSAIPTDHQPAVNSKKLVIAS